MRVSQRLKAVKQSPKGPSLYRKPEAEKRLLCQAIFLLSGLCLAYLFSILAF
jgi:hypothetical protein